MLAVIYARVSPGEHSKKGHSMAEQLKLCRQKATELAQGAPVEVQEFSDSDTSGDIPPADRRGFAEALATAKSRRAAWFICLDPDRFSRDTYQALGAAQDVDRTGAKLEFVLHSYENSPEGQLFFTLRVGIATFEKHKIKERTQRGIRGKLAKGGLPFAPRPYGYRFDKESDTLQVVDEQARWVRDMFSWILEERMGPHLIAQRLNELGAPAPRGSWWYKQGVAKMLRNPVYMGRLVVMKTDQSGMRRNRHLPPDQRAKKRRRPPEEWVSLPVAPLVEPELWARAQGILDEGRRRRPGAPLTPYLLTGVCVCGLCGRPGHGFSNGAGRRYYICSGRHHGLKYLDPARHPEGPCKLPHLRIEPIEEHVRQVVGGWLANPNEYRATRRQAREEAAQGAPAGELERIQAARAELEAEWDRRVELFQRGLVRDQSRAQAEIEEVQRRVEALRRQEEALLLRAEYSAAAEPDDLDDVAAAMAGRLNDLDDEEWRMAIRMLVARVVLQPGSKPKVDPR